VSAPVLAVAGTPYPYHATTLKVEDRLNEHSTLEVVVDDEHAAYTFTRGQQVLVTQDSATLFAGHVGQVTTTYNSSTGSINHTLRCVDHAYLAEKRLAAAAYTALTVRQIATNLIATYLAEEGVVGWTSQWCAFDGTGDQAIADRTTAITGDLDVRAKIRATDYTPAAIKVICAHAGASGNRGWALALNATTGRPMLRYSTNGTTWVDDVATAALPSVTDNVTDIWVRATLDVDNGASGRSTRFYSSADGITWTQLGSTVTTAGTVTLYSPTGIGLSVGAINDTPTFSDGWAGPIYEVQIYDGTTLVCRPRFDTYYHLATSLFEWAEGDTHGHDAQGNIWTLGGDAAITRTWAIDTGGTITQVTFDYVDCASALDQLAEKMGWWWNIDASRVLWLKPRTYQAAPWTADAGDMVAGTVEVQSTADQYRNVQWVRAGQDLTASQAEIFSGDGERTTFTVAYPVNAQPTVEANVGAGYVAKTVGIRGVETGHDWYWSKGDPQISQDSGGTPLAATDLLRVTYVGRFPLIVRSWDQGQISTLKAADGGSGKVESAVDAAWVEDRDSGFELAATYLNQYGQDTHRLTFDTYTAGLAPGQLLTVTLTPHGLTTAELLVEAVTTVHLGNGLLRYTVIAVEGTPGKSWVEFFRTLVRLRARTGESAATAEVVAVLAEPADNWTWSETVTPTAWECPVPSTTLYPSSTLYPC
jgi:hypothetical protein